jgi:hypothetical protein
MRFIPPRYCHWKVFAQIASGFGLLTEVDWPTLFKTFYEVVRIKVACKDWRKIPAERLYEMDKKLYVVSLLVENEEDNGKAVDGKGDDGGNDGDKGLDEDNDEEADDLDDSEGENAGDNDKDQTPKNLPRKNTGYKTVSMGLDSKDIMNQSKLMELEMMGQTELLTASGEVGVRPNYINVNQVNC